MLPVVLMRWWLACFFSSISFLHSDPEGNIVLGGNGICTCRQGRQVCPDMVFNWTEVIVRVCLMTAAMQTPWIKNTPIITPGAGIKSCNDIHFFLNMIFIHQNAVIRNSFQMGWSPNAVVRLSSNYDLKRIILSSSQQYKLASNYFHRQWLLTIVNLI